MGCKVVQLWGVKLYNYKVLPLGSAELLSLVANSEKQYPLTQETVSATPINYLR